jgi:adenosylmethionine-8-amino-7-oxononanoate aminotransferase
MGAAVATTEVADRFTGKGNHFRHVFTASGHPVAAAASLKNIEIIETEALVQNAAEVGGYLKEQLEGLMVDHPTVGDVRGLGLLTSLELVSDRGTKARFEPELELPTRLNQRFRDHGLILRLNGSILNICPPLCVTRDEVDEIVHAIDLSLWELEGELGIAKMA